MEKEIFVQKLKKRTKDFAVEEANEATKIMTKAKNTTYVNKQ